MDFKVLLETFDKIDEKITKDTPMGDVIKDFQKSDAPQFKGKSKEERKNMALAAKLSKESVEEAELRRLSGLPEKNIREANMDLSDKSEELTQWVLKYDGYRGNNGDELPMGWIKSMTATGVGPDGWEEDEWEAYQEKLGKDITDMDNAEIDAFIDNPQNSPITSAMIDDLLKITGASTADEDLARAVSSAIGIGESIQEGAGSLDSETVEAILKLKEVMMDKGMEPEEAQDEAAETFGVDPEELADYLDSQYDESVSLGEGPTQLDSETVEAILKLKEVMMDKGMEPEEAQDEAAETFGVDPEELADYLDSQYDESLEEEADIDLSKYSKEMLDKIKNASDAELNKMAVDFGGSSMEIGREEELFRKIRAQLNKQDEGFDRDSFRKAFESMVESKFKKGDKVTVDGEETEITVPDGPGPLVGVKKDGKTDMVKADKVKKKTDTDESVEEGKSKHPKGSEKYKKQMAAKHASMNEDEMDIDANMDMPVDPDQEMTASPEQVIDQADEVDMAMGQLEFMKYAAEEIKGHFKMGFEMEEWFQNKLARVHGTMMTLHAYIEGEEGKAGMNESINESIEKFFQEDKLGFEDALRVVRESGGQQTIRFADTALYKWASRVANAKFEGRKAELYAGLLYERNGGDIEITDVLNESE